VKRHLVALITLSTAVVLAALALGLLYSAYRRSRLPLELSRQAVVTEGIITEKLVQRQSDRLLPFDVPAFVVRYAYPTLDGQMRTGEQVVTRGFFERIGDPGTHVPVTMQEDNPSLSAVDPRLTFPGSVGWRMGAALVALFTASTLVGGGLRLWRNRIS
jgi:hypothetical protein